MMNDIHISIITVCINADKYIENCIQSVISQTYKNYEYIVIDGGSADQTNEIIQKYTDQISVYISEPDDGIADAMNKAISLSSGEYIFFVHADDYLISPTILTEIFAYIDVTSPICIFNLNKSEHGIVTELKPRGFNSWMNFKTGIYHQGSICKKSLFVDIGSFDVNLRIAMDYEFFLRSYRAGIKHEYYNFPICVMRDTGVSSRVDKKSLNARFREERRIQKQHCNTFLMKIIYVIYWPLYLAYRHVR